MVSEAGANGHISPYPLNDVEKELLSQIQIEQQVAQQKANMWMRMVEARLGLMAGSIGMPGTEGVTHALTEDSVVKVELDK
jgi:hypothetical protein